MRDSFLATHHEICLVSGTKRFDPDIQPRMIRFLETNTFNLPEHSDLDRTRHVQTHEAFFRRLLETHNIGFMMTLPEIEKLVFQAVILYGYMNSVRCLNMTENQRRSNSVITMMLKQKLIELFLDLDPKDVSAVFEIETILPKQKHIWKSVCDHARSITQTIRLFSEMEEYWMFTPTLFESYMLATDVILFSEENGPWCVQVKQPHKTDLEFLIESVEEKPQGSTLSKENEWLRRLFCGIQHFNNLYPEYSFIPCRITMLPEYKSNFDSDISKAYNFFFGPDSDEMKGDDFAA